MEDSDIVRTLISAGTVCAHLYFTRSVSKMMCFPVMGYLLTKDGEDESHDFTHVTDLKAQPHVLV